MPLTQVILDPETGSQQQTEITRLIEVRDRLGEATATPTANTLNDRLLTLLVRFGDAVASPAANSLLARVQAQLDRFGNISDAAAATPTSNSSFISLFKLFGSNFANRIPTGLTVNNNRLQVDIGSTSTPGTPAIIPNTLSTTASIITPANSNRKSLTFYNNLGVPVYVDQFATVTTSSFKFPLAPGGFYEHPMNLENYLGIWYAILPSGTGSINVRETS